MTNRTKRQYIWRFNLGDKDCCIELFKSTMSGKKSLVINGQEAFKKKQ